MLKKVYVFRTSWQGLIPELYEGKLIHEVEGTVTPKYVRFDGEHYRAELLNYKRRLRIGDGVFLTFEEAKAAARKRIALRIEGLEKELEQCKEALLQAS